MSTISAANAAVSRIKSAVRRESTILRLGGDGFFWSLTWAADDRQLVAMVDGAGWPAVPKHHYYSSRLLAVTGAPDTATFQDFPTYPDIPLNDILQRKAPPYYSCTALAVDGCIYQYLSTSTVHVFTEDVYLSREWHWDAAKLIYSPDNGRTWLNQDGSAPVVRELHESQSHENMTFLKEPQDAFSLLSFLQMGKDYRDNRDGYVYVYSPNGSREGAINELVMFRVLKERIREREAYEFFSGLKDDGDACWDKDINSRRVVHTFPRGLASYRFDNNAYFDGSVAGANFFAWLPSVVYNAPLGIYMMANSNAAHVFTSLEGNQPGYLGLWVAAHPWGPWRQIHEEIAWTPGGDPGTRAGGPVISPKWISADGNSFWLLWCDGGLRKQGDEGISEEALMKSIETLDEKKAFEGRLQWYRYHSGWSFNVQRVDLSID